MTQAATMKIGAAGTAGGAKTPGDRRDEIHHPPLRWGVPSARISLQHRLRGRDATAAELLDRISAQGSAAVVKAVSAKTGRPDASAKGCSAVENRKWIVRQSLSYAAPYDIMS
jgi:hypothetical protein